MSDFEYLSKNHRIKWKLGVVACLNLQLKINHNLAVAFYSVSNDMLIISYARRNSRPFCCC